MKNPTLEKKQLKARISYNFNETVIKVINMRLLEQHQCKMQCKSALLDL